MTNEELLRRAVSPELLERGRAVTAEAELLKQATARAFAHSDALHRQRCALVDGLLWPEPLPGLAR